MLSKEIVGPPIMVRLVLVNCVFNLEKVIEKINEMLYLVDPNGLFTLTYLPAAFYVPTPREIPTDICGGDGRKICLECCMLCEQFLRNIFKVLPTLKTGLTIFLTLNTVSGRPKETCFVDDYEYGIIRIGTIESTAKAVVSTLYRIITWDTKGCSKECLANPNEWLFTEKFCKEHEMKFRNKSEETRIQLLEKQRKQQHKNITKMYKTRT
ncbi:MAG: hypothetical protein ACTSXW_08880 [Candidatus Baldrarchaeia archaeon]